MNIRSDKQFFLSISFIAMVFLTMACTKNGDNGSVNKTGDSKGNDAGLWVTTGDKTLLLTKMSDKITFEDEAENGPVIKVDTAETFQTIDGFGFTLTGGSAMLIHSKLTSDERAQLLKELFSTENEGIGISYLRVSVGASDLDEYVYSYYDLPKGQRDTSLKGFSLAYDTLHLVPVLKEILAINPEIKIMGSPWSAPAWMKTNQSPIGGKLKPEFYDAYAKYFVKYVKAMEDEGITIDAITLQNEPEHPGNNPSMLMTAEEQALFVKKHIGPAFEEAGIDTKIVVFDHNCDNPGYPIAVLNDQEARKYIDGSAFHLYLGEIEALSQVHNAHPDKNLYFTEQWTSAKGEFKDDLRWHVKNLIIGATRNWSRTVLEWNLAADPDNNPHTDQGGCTMCLGALTIGDSITRNVAYYIIGHASRFVPAGSVRIASSITDGLHNVAFKTPSGKKVLVVMNDNDEEKVFNIEFGGKVAKASLPAGAAGTFVW